MNDIQLSQAAKALVISMAIGIVHSVKNGKLPKATMVPFVLDGEDLVPFDDGAEDDDIQALINKNDMSGLAYRLGGTLALPNVKAVGLFAGAAGVAQKHCSREEAVAKLVEIADKVKSGEKFDGLSHFFVGLLVTPHNSIHAMWDATKLGDTARTKEAAAEACASMHVSADSDTFVGPVTPQQVQEAFRHLSAARAHGIH